MTDHDTLTDGELLVLDKLLANATPGPWMMATSNSYRRIVTQREHDTVLWAITQRSDGHPDLAGTEADKELLIAARNVLPHLLAEVRRLRGDGKAYDLSKWVSGHPRRTYIATYCPEAEQHSLSLVDDFSVIGRGDTPEEAMTNAFKKWDEVLNGNQQ